MSKTFTALGLMSGTSLDGIDVALIKTDGVSIVERGPCETYPYHDGMQDLLRRAIQDAVSVDRRDDRTGVMAEAEAAMTFHHIEAVNSFSAKYDLNHSNIDVIGFHGQTMIHRPEKHLTVQLGLGDELSKALGIPVVFDMRAADVAAGGQGAPLVPVYHRALAKNPPVAFVNIGGVANVTYVGVENELLAFDTGPGNALINDWVQHHTGQFYDKDGTMASQGRVSPHLLSAALNHPYFSGRPPKSLDRNSFSSLNFGELNAEDGAATLVAFTVQTIANAAKWFPKPVHRWIICGGGRHNKAIMAGLNLLLDKVESAEQAGFNGDGMEAEAWAYLAVRSMLGLPLTYPETTGIKYPQTGGVLVGRRKE